MMDERSISAAVKAAQANPKLEDQGVRAFVEGIGLDYDALCAGPGDPGAVSQQLALFGVSLDEEESVESSGEQPTEDTEETPAAPV